MSSSIIVLLLLLLLLLYFDAKETTLYDDDDDDDDFVSSSPRGRALYDIRRIENLYIYIKEDARLSLSLSPRLFRVANRNTTTTTTTTPPPLFFSTQKKGARYAYKVARVFLMSKSEKKERNDDDAQKCVFCLAFFLCEKTQKNSSTILFFI